MGFSNYAEQEWLKQYYRQLEMWEKYFQGQYWSIEKEQNMNKSMGHFTDWKFGVPVRVMKQRSGCSLGKSRLIYETNIEFVTINNAGGVMTLCKASYYYELIPYKSYHKAAPRYPVCKTPQHVAYCNSNDGSMERLETINANLFEIIPESTATPTIDGKEIKLSAETVARLKEELGV